MTDKQLAILIRKYEDLLAEAIHYIEDTMAENAGEDYNPNDNFWMFEPLWGVVGKISNDYYLLIGEHEST